MLYIIIIIAILSGHWSADPMVGKVTEYGHSRYIRNHKSYTKILMNIIFIII